MDDFALAAVTLIAGALLGHAVKLTEFRREHRVRAYGEFVAAFLSAAHAGAALHSLYFTMGETIYRIENREKVEPWWNLWAESAGEFEAAAARVRLVSSDRMLVEIGELEDFITANIRRVPPLYQTEGTNGWGEAAKAGPAMVDSEAVRLGRQFADRARLEVSRLRGWLPSARTHGQPA